MITIDQAREALIAARSEAGDREHFDGERLDGGWLFTWSTGGDIPAGTSGWVVADNGAVEALKFWRPGTPTEVLARLNASPAHTSPARTP